MSETTPKAPTDVAREAISYVLRRIGSDPDARYLFGFATESLRQLCEGYAALSKEPMTAKEVEDLVLQRRQDSLGESAWDRIEKLTRRVGELEAGR